MVDNQYKIDLGVGLNQSQLNNVKQILESIENQKRDVIYNVDFNIKNIDKLTKVGKEIEEIQAQLKGKSQNALPVDTKNVEKSLDNIHESIKKIQNAFGRVDKNKGTQSLLTTVNKIRQALEGVTSQFGELNKNLTALSNKNLSLNLDFGFNKKKSQEQILSEFDMLKREAKAYEDYFAKVFHRNGGAGYGDNRGAIGRLIQQTNPKNMKYFLGLTGGLGSGSGNASEKANASLRAYINLIKEAAAVGGYDLSIPQARLSGDSGFVQIQNEINETEEKLKQLFSGGIDAEKLHASLDRIVEDLEKVQVSLDKFADGVSFKGVAEQFEQLSNSIEQLLQNANQVKVALGDGLIGDVDTNTGEVKEIQEVIEHQKSEARQAQETANTVVQSEERKQQALRETADAAEKVKTASFADENDVDDIKETSNELTKLKNLAHQIGQLDFKIVKSDYKDEVNQVREFERQLELLKIQYNETLNSLSAQGIDINSEDITREFVEARNKIAEFEAKVKDTKAELAKKIKLGLDDGNFDVVAKLDRDVKSLSGSYPKLEAGIQEVKNVLKEMEVAAGTEDEVADVEKLISAHERFEHALKNVNNQLKENKNRESSQYKDDSLGLKKQAALLEIDNYLNNNTRAAKELKNEFRDLAIRIDACDDSNAFTNLNRELKNLKTQANLTLDGKTQSIGDKLKKQFSQYSSYLSVASLFMYAEQGLRSMFEQVKLIDSAMTELKKVTDETDASYNKFLSNAATRSKEIGTTIDGLVSSTADFARLGYGFEDAQGLAEVANIYAVVGDEIEGVEGATESLISTMAAFKDEMNGMSNSDFAMSIIDKFNEIGNNFAISSGGIGEAMERSASSLMAANNTIDESIALITAANTVVQDPAQVGKVMPTIKVAISVKLLRRTRPSKDFVYNY